MPANFGACRGLLFAVLLLLVAAIAPGQAAPGQASPPAAAKNAQSSSAPAATAPSSDASKYVGAETCKTCHEEIYNSWEKTPHWKTTLNKEGGPSKQGCEGCHGPGADHVAGGGDKTKIFVFEGKVPSGNQCPLSHLPWRKSSAVALCGIRARQQRCRLSRLPLSASRQRKRAPAGPEPAPVVLRMPHFGQGGFCQALSPPRQRRSGAMQ